MVNWLCESVNSIKHRLIHLRVGITDADLQSSVSVVLRLSFSEYGLSAIQTVLQLKTKMHNGKCVLKFYVFVVLKCN